MEKNETKRRTRSSDAKLLGFWETLTRDQQFRALRVLAALMDREIRPRVQATDGVGVED